MKFDYTCQKKKKISTKLLKLRSWLLGFFPSDWGLRQDCRLDVESKCLHYIYSTGGTKSLNAGAWSVSKLQLYFILLSFMFFQTDSFIWILQCIIILFKGLYFLTVISMLRMYYCTGFFSNTSDPLAAK